MSDRLEENALPAITKTAGTNEARTAEAQQKLAGEARRAGYSFTKRGAANICESGQHVPTANPDARSI